MSDNVKLEAEAIMDRARTAHLLGHHYRERRALQEMQELLAELLQKSGES